MIKKIKLKLVCTACLSVVVLTPQSSFGAKRPVSVEDIVQEVIVGRQSWMTEDPLTRSVAPNGKFAFLVTRRGDIAQGVNHYDLLLFNLTNLGSGRRTAPLSLLSLSSQGRGDMVDGAIRDVRWMKDSRTLAYIGVEHDQPAPAQTDQVVQVYTIDIFTHVLRQKTNVPLGVLSYDFDASGNIVISTARAHCNTVDCERSDEQAVRIVSPETSLNVLLKPDEWRYRPVVYELWRSEGGISKRVGKRFVAGGPPALDLNPTGDMSTVQLHETSQTKTESWGMYGGLYEILAARAAANRSINIWPPSASRASRTALVDIGSGAMSDPLDAPDGALLSNAIATEWFPEGDRILFVNALEPMTGLGGNVSHGPALIEYALKPKTYEIVARGELSSVQITDFRSIRVQTLQGASKCYRKDRQKWQEFSCPVARRIADRWQIKKLETMASRPRIFAVRPAGNVSVELLDPNPQFDELDFGRVVEFSPGTDRRSEKVSGLVYPAGFKPGTRYPLVIVLGGFVPGSFVTDSSRHNPSEIPAQALAGRGLFVLMVADRPSSTHEQVKAYRSYIESSIETLSEQGLIDPARVGIQGFSRMGMIALDTITFAKTPIAAAVIADSKGYGLFSSVAYEFPDMRDNEVALGAMPWGDGVQDWVARDPAFNVDKIRAATRFRLHSIYVPPSWDVYALMRRLSKPTEMVIVPGANHLLWNPVQRYEALQGDVDWFEFWLSDSRRSESRDRPPEKSTR